MGNPFILLNVAAVAVFFSVTWWYARSASRHLRQARKQVAAMERQTLAKTEELQSAYTRTLREIAERRLTEDKLRISEARFAAFMRHLPGTASMRDAQGRYLFANDTWERVFGRDWHGRTLEEVWPADQAQSFLEMDQWIIENGQPLERIETLQQNGNTQFWLINRFTIVNRDERGVMVGSIGIDITGRRQAEEALRESEQKLRSLTSQLLFAQENERKRLAAELHDELGHSLLILKGQGTQVLFTIPLPQGGRQGETLQYSPG